jgi:hypothetical protein
MRISTWLVPVLVIATVACSGCKKKKAPIDAPPPPIDAPEKDISTGAGPGPRQLVALGEPFHVEADGPGAGDPGLAVDAEGKPLLAFVEKGKVHVRRWNGTAWDALGTPPNGETGRASGRPSIAFEDGGGILVGWLEMNKNDISVFQVARWKDNAWAPLGELGSGKEQVVDPVLATSPFGAVAVWREAEKLGVDVVHVASLDATGAWKPLGGDGTLRGAPDSTTKVAPALATSKGGVLVGWIERSPAPVLQLRRWDAASSAWIEVPAPEGADGDSTLALALSPDGTATVSLSYNIGLRQVVTLAPGATEWKKIDVPELSNGYVRDQRLAAVEDGRVLFSYSFAGRFGWWDGKEWTATPVGVMAPSMVVPYAVGGPGGVVFVGWSQGPANGPARVRVLEVKKQALGE